MWLDAVLICRSIHTQRQKTNRTALCGRTGSWRMDPLNELYCVRWKGKIFITDYGFYLLTTVPFSCQFLLYLFMFVPVVNSFELLRYLTDYRSDFNNYKRPRTYFRENRMGLCDCRQCFGYGFIESWSGSNILGWTPIHIRIQSGSRFWWSKIGNFIA